MSSCFAGAIVTTLLDSPVGAAWVVARRAERMVREKYMLLALDCCGQECIKMLRLGMIADGLLCS